LFSARFVLALALVTAPLVLSSLVPPPPCHGRHHHFRSNTLS
jgi:hypothetical protein